MTENGSTKEVLIKSNEELGSKLQSEFLHSHAEGIVSFSTQSNEVFLHRLCPEQSIFKQELVNAIASISKKINLSRIYIDISNDIFLFPDTLYDLFGAKCSHYWLATPHSFSPYKDFYIAPPYVPKEIPSQYALTPIRLTRNPENLVEAHFNTEVSTPSGSPLVNVDDPNHIGVQGILYIPN